MTVHVVGSINYDTFITVPQFPLPGETLRGTTLQHSLGGKGLNQALAGARMGAQVRMVGAIGRELETSPLWRALGAEPRLNLDGVAEDPQAPTGQAFVSVDRTGENTIVIFEGANLCAAVDLPTALEPVSARDVLVCQLEIPPGIVRGALNVARERGATTILNAAPFSPIEELADSVDLLIVNLTEARGLLGETGEGAADEALAGVIHAARGLDVVVTGGSSGAWWATTQGDGFHPAFPVDSIDSTGAGDVFVGAVAAELQRGSPLAVAVRFAAAAAALACTHYGAQSYQHRRAEVERFIDAHPAKTAQIGGHT